MKIGQFDNFGRLTLIHAVDENNKPVCGTKIKGTSKFIHTQHALLECFRCGKWMDKNEKSLEKMRYEAGDKEFSMYQFVVDNEGSESELESFLTWAHSQGYKFYDVILIDALFIDYISQHECFIDYLIERGYIRLPWETIKITLSIESEKELFELWHRLNVDNEHLKTYKAVQLSGTPDYHKLRELNLLIEDYYTFDIFEQIDDIVKEYLYTSIGLND